MSRPRLVWDSRAQLYKAECGNSERDIFRRAGFKWHQDVGALTTPSALIAGRVKAFATPSAHRMILDTFIQVKPWSGRIKCPPKLSPLPFQPGAARFAIERNRSYLALDPGLGKGVVAALILNALGLHPVVYICPPFLALTVQEELCKWLVKPWSPLDVRIYDDKECSQKTPGILIVPDSMAGNVLGENEGAHEAIEFMRDRGGATLIIDEAHRYKTAGAQRTEGLFRFAHGFKRIVFLSGTPMPNRPHELYPILSRFAPETIDFMTEKAYGMKYCAGFYDGFGYDYKGASNVKELATKVRSTFMLRLRKKDVLKQLPPKTEELVFLANDLPPQMAVVDREMLKRYSPEDTLRVSDEHISSYRKRLGLVKAPLAIGFIRDLLEDGDESILVFAEHIDVIAKLEKGLAKFKPLVITGSTPKKRRHAIVKEFQTNKTRRLFLGNKKACGVGFTLIKATRVIHVEPGWVPGDDDQATDRAHRIGQLDNVFVQYLVFKNSFDRTVMDKNLRKRKTTQML